MSKQPNYVFDDELYHWGILGQRWGHRRFQNEDGSWTSEGRERYGKGDDARTKAKITYNTQKYKADLKSKAQKEKDIRSAKEERNRIKEKENAILDKKGRKNFGNTKNLSDDDLQKAIDRLELQAEYNKQYVLATSKNSALVKADRFFESPTGKFVRDLAVQTLPNVANTAMSKILDANLKYKNKLDVEKAKADIAKANADIVKVNADIAKTKADAYNTMQKAYGQHMKNILDGYEWHLDPKTNKWLMKKK